MFDSVMAVRTTNSRRQKYNRSIPFLQFFESDLLTIARNAFELS